MIIERKMSFIRSILKDLIEKKLLHGIKVTDIILEDSHPLFIGLYVYIKRLGCEHKLFIVINKDIVENTDTMDIMVEILSAISHKLGINYGAINIYDADEDDLKAGVDEAWKEKFKQDWNKATSTVKEEVQWYMIMKFL